MSVNFVQLLEKWPRIGRFSTAIIDRNSAKIMVISWPLLGAILLFSLVAMRQYFAFMEDGIDDLASLLFYVLCLLSFMLIPKFGAGLIRGTTIFFCPDYFHEKLKEAYKEGKTMEELYLPKEHIDAHKILQTGPKKYGIKKTIGNFLLL